VQTERNPRHPPAATGLNASRVAASCHIGICVVAPFSALFQQPHKQLRREHRFA